MSDEDSTYIICLRQTFEGTIVRDSLTSNCCECDSPIWITPATMKIMVDEDAKLICFQCVEARKKKEEIEVQPPTQEQIKEAIKELTNENNPTKRISNRTQR